jgi:hypothetical protein
MAKLLELVQCDVSYWIVKYNGPVSFQLLLLSASSSARYLCLLICTL